MAVMCDHQSTREVTLIFVGKLIVPERLGDTQEIIQYIYIYIYILYIYISLIAKKKKYSELVGF